MKINKPTKKSIIIFSTICIFITVFILFTGLTYFKKNEYQLIDEFYEKIFKTEFSCIQGYKQINENINKSNFDEKLFKQGVKVCNESYEKIKIIPIPEKLPQQAKNVLKNSRKNLSESNKYNTLSLEELLKTKGDYNYSNKHYGYYLYYFEKSYDSSKFVFKDMAILKNYIIKKGSK